MARRRYQQGSIGERGETWEVRWMEDVQENGSIRRVHRSKSIPKSEFPTRSLAKRERDRILEDAGVKTENYSPTQLGCFETFVAKWLLDVASTMAESTQSAAKSELKAWKTALVVFRNGERISMPMREIDSGVMQTVISAWHTGGRGLKKVGEKTIQNRVKTLQNAWKWALEWRFTRTPFPTTLRLPYWDKDEAKARRPAYSMEDMKRVIAESEFPYNLIWWLTYELHVRRGEVCGLDIQHLNLAQRQITVRRNRVMSAVKSTKARKPRIIGISRELCEALRPIVRDRAPSEPLFLSPEGCRLHPENLAKRKLNPLLTKLGLKVKGTALHGFRHGAATELDRHKVPMATRLNRLGHSDEPTAYLYTHASSEDDKQVAEIFGRELSGAFTQTLPNCEESEGGAEDVIVGTA